MSSHLASLVAVVMIGSIVVAGSALTLSPPRTISTTVQVPPSTVTSIQTETIIENQTLTMTQNQTDTIIRNQTVTTTSLSTSLGTITETVVSRTTVLENSTSTTTAVTQQVSSTSSRYTTTYVPPPPTSTSTITTTSNATNQTSSTNSTTTTTTTTTTSSVDLSYHLNVIYTISNQTMCDPYPLVQCTWTGSINWRSAACYLGCSYVIGPTHGDSSWSVTLSGCGSPINWSLSMNTPTNQSTLAVTITNANGFVVYSQSTSPGGSSGLSGSWAPC